MSYNYGTTSVASIISGGANTVVSASTGGTTGQSIRVFDFVLLDTAAIVNLYAQDLATGATTFVLHFDRGNVSMTGNAGIDFLGNIISSSNARANNIATITYIKEF